MQSCGGDSLCPEKATPSSASRVGEVSLPGARAVRIVHISDTHLRHEMYMNNIPPGDILIHSGDFSQLHFSRYIFRERVYKAEIKMVNVFFSKLPHKHKIFVAGNHEMNFEREKISRTEGRMTHGIYLQDSMVTVEGIRIYGSPWSGLRKNSSAREFTAPYSELNKFWDLIPGPGEVDVLVTHSPPGNILSGGMGSESLKEAVLGRVKPRAHLFGHAHGANGTKYVGPVLFSNASIMVRGAPKVIDYYVDPTKMKTDLKSVHYANYPKNETQRYCSIM